MVATRIKSFVLENFLFTENESVLRNDQSLFASGTLDSTGILELVSFVEETFGISIDDDEMIPANFETIDALAAFVSRKKLPG